MINQASRYNEWDIDELVYVDISRYKEYDLRRDDHKIKSYFSIEEIIKEISKVCFMPLTFGGGIKTIEDIDLRIQHGADKISINTAALMNIDLVTQASRKYGNQCVVISVDYRIIDNTPIVFSHCGQENTGLDLFTWIRRCEDAGAGELFINSIERDGMGNGYDIDTIREAYKVTSLPIIACGGAGDPYDFVDLANEVNISGIAAGNIFHFTERSYPRAKQLLKKNNINVR
ncbi:MAG: imidazole glycerol phosphate synthase cyclase subunit [Chitinophagaceae bacterium]|nr:MAG: imidazole glycerol phosphate synthase cyclase subunit [Chitinophagaceae bacterium]